MRTDPDEFVAGLREIADWYEQHPEIPPPDYFRFVHIVSQSGVWTTDDDEGRFRINGFAAALGTEVTVVACKERHHHAERMFGPIHLVGVFIPTEPSEVTP